MLNFKEIRRKSSKIAHNGKYQNTMKDLKYVAPIFKYQNMIGLKYRFFFPTKCAQYLREKRREEFEPLIWVIMCSEF